MLNSINNDLPKTQQNIVEVNKEQKNTDEKKNNNSNKIKIYLKINLDQQFFQTLKHLV